MKERVLNFQNCDKKLEEAEEIMKKFPASRESYHRCMVAKLNTIMNATFLDDDSDEKVEVTLYPDFVKGSFGFTVTMNGKFRYNGGIICHSADTNPEWSTHT